MKTATNNSSLGIKIQIAILLLTLLALFSRVSGSVINIEDIPALPAEVNVNDIPFDTHEIAIDYFFDQAMVGAEMPATTDVNDIPFNTKLIQELILANYTNSGLLLEPEQSFNDIPFDTHDIAQEQRFSLLSDVLVLDTENSVNDSPFDASVILSQVNQQKKSTTEFNLAINLPDHILNRLVNLVKAGLISILILLSAVVLGFLFFSYVY